MFIFSYTHAHHWFSQILVQFFWNTSSVDILPLFVKSSSIFLMPFLESNYVKVYQDIFLLGWNLSLRVSNIWIKNISLIFVSYGLKFIIYYLVPPSRIRSLSQCGISIFCNCNSNYTQKDIQIIIFLWPLGITCERAGGLLHLQDYEAFGNILLTRAEGAKEAGILRVKVWKSWFIKNLIYRVTEMSFWHKINNLLVLWHMETLCVTLVGPTANMK